MVEGGSLPLRGYGRGVLSVAKSRAALRIGSADSNASQKTPLPYAPTPSTGLRPRNAPVDSAAWVRRNCAQTGKTIKNLLEWRFGGIKRGEATRKILKLLPKRPKIE